MKIAWLNYKQYKLINYQSFLYVWNIKQNIIRNSLKQTKKLFNGCKVSFELNI